MLKKIQIPHQPKKENKSVPKMCPPNLLQNLFLIRNRMSMFYPQWTIFLNGICLSVVALRVRLDFPLDQITNHEKAVQNNKVSYFYLLFLKFIRALIHENLFYDWNSFNCTLYFWQLSIQIYRLFRLSLHSMIFFC